MRIAILDTGRAPAACDPTHRITRDLAGLLAADGHEVALIGDADPDRLPAGVDPIRPRRLPRAPGLDWYERDIEAAPSVLAHVMRGSYDVAHAFDPVHAWTCVRAAALGAPPTILSLDRMPDRPYLVGRRYRLELLRTAIAGCVATTVPSEAAARLVRRYLMADPLVVPPGVLLPQPDVGGERATVPTLVCPCEPELSDQARRGVLDAFARLRERRADARLLMLRSASEPVGAAATTGVAWVPIRDRGELASLLAAAWAVVLAPGGDATALSAFEALAAGTPVAVPERLAEEVVGKEPIGCGFDPEEPGGLAAAMSAALDLAADPRTNDACRRRIEDRSWEGRRPSYEELYRRALGAAEPAISGRGGR